MRGNCEAFLIRFHFFLDDKSKTALSGEILQITTLQSHVTIAQNQK